MSSRLSRRELKTDEVRQVMVRLIELLTKKWRQVAVGAGIVVAGVLITWGVVKVRSLRFEKAQIELVEAREVYSAPVDILAVSGNDASFVSETERSAAARERFETVVANYGRSPAAAVARAYLAEIRARQGSVSEARSLWQALVDGGGDDALTLSAEINLIHLDRQEGRLDELVTSLQAQLEDPNSFLPAEIVLFELGVTLEGLGRPEEAQEAFQRVVDEYPSSAYSIEARQRLRFTSAG